MKIGIVAESMGMPLRSVLTEASRMGVTGVQVNAVGDLAPERLTETGRREVRHLLRSYGIVFTALHCPMRFGLDVAERLTERIERLRAAMSLSYDLGAKIVVVQLGKMPEDRTTPSAQRLIESLTDLGHHGDRTGTQLAIESGLNSGAALAEFLNTFDTAGIAVNYDPGNMLMHGYDPTQNLLPLTSKIVHSHARDVRPAMVNQAASEVPLGAGHIDWMAYTATLQAMEYRGYLAVERESGDHKAADVEAGVEFLRRFVM